MIKNYIFNIVFKKQLEKFNNLYEESTNRINEIEEQLSREQQVKDLLKDILADTRDLKIIALEENEDNEDIIVVESRSDNRFDIELYGKSYSDRERPRLMSCIRDGVEGSYLYIQDFQMIKNEIGNGEIAMKYFLKLAHKLDVNYISGQLSYKDRDHFDRLEYFYSKKFGFEVVFNETRTEGSIKKLVNERV